MPTLIRGNPETCFSAPEDVIDETPKKIPFGDAADRGGHPVRHVPERKIAHRPDGRKKPALPAPLVALIPPAPEATKLMPI